MFKVAGFVKDYLAHLEAGFTVADHGGFWEVTTPFLDRHNDHVSIYVSLTESGFHLTDDGEALFDLRVRDIPLTGAAVTETLNGFGVPLVGGSLTLDCSPSEFGQAFHRFLGAMLALAWIG